MPLTIGTRKKKGRCLVPKEVLETPEFQAEIEVGMAAAMELARHGSRMRAGSFELPAWDDEGGEWCVHVWRVSPPPLLN